MTFKRYLEHNCKPFIELPVQLSVVANESSTRDWLTVQFGGTGKTERPSTETSANHRPREWVQCSALWQSTHNCNSIATKRYFSDKFKASADSKLWALLPVLHKPYVWPEKRTTERIVSSEPSIWSPKISTPAQKLRPIVVNTCALTFCSLVFPVLSTQSHYWYTCPAIRGECALGAVTRVPVWHRLASLTLKTTVLAIKLFLLILLRFERFSQSRMRSRSQYNCHNIYI